MSSNIPAAALSKMRPDVWSQGRVNQYLTALEYVIDQIQGQTGLQQNSLAGVEPSIGVVNPVQAANRQDIQTNAENIQTNADSIQTNADNIQANTDAIASNAEEILENEVLSSASMVMIAEMFRRLDNGEYSPIFGTGNPNTGSVVANYSGTFYDTSVPSHWVNSTVGATSGWVQVV